ncbi:uncharacterized protein LOC127868447 [Dreissena polymorpha]|uniref:uncharacterized protein LOC127868447 n=1 Tax=Dreissena polymorpha TaxID=45954 RepID=UPI002264102F|nr:uncharacterized protein LOC127868447 [Dreissena polymorpha]XP_052266194.1 uncharacterized protein LOC127868447 [Dreissena polymorpha]XP_052266195.1 uncharacterized protein LOC127868447 [Dreissena polymorpha]XP_052266196.1 uncharacterized protein LOC127868447 [Dreissena polymorpha]
MKERQQSEGDSGLEPHLFTSETYLGTKMDEKALTFHTQLHDWNEAQILVSKHTHLLTAAHKQDVFLPVKKLAQVEYWTRQVNRFYGPPKNSRPKSGSFMKIDVTKYNMKVDKDEATRSRSAIYPQRTRATSAVSRATTTKMRSRFFGNDYHTVKNNLAESQIFYSSQRRNLHSGTTAKSKKSSKTDELKTAETAASEVVTNSKFDNGTETVTIIDDDSKASDIESLETEVMQPFIVARSYSNRELNVISIDDCKITCRYRPQLIKENRKMLDEVEESDDEETLAKVLGKVPHAKQKVVKDSSHKDSEGRNGFDADDEISSESVHTIDNALNDIVIQDGVVDTNNNTRSCSRIQNCAPSKDSKNENNSRDKSIRNSKGSSPKASSAEDSSAGNSHESETRSDKSAFQNGHSEQEHSMRPRVNFSSRGSSKASYGRVTALSARQPGTESRNEVTKQVSRSARINHAINNVVQDRRLMNAEKDFDTRTAVYGRTVVDVSEGSERFKKLHASLRKKIDNYVETHSAVNTKDYYERCRRNSAINSVKS